MNIGEVVTCFIVALEVTLSADEVVTGCVEPFEKYNKSLTRLAFREIRVIISLYTFKMKVDTHNGVGVYFFHRTIRRMYGNGKVQFSEKHMGNGYTVGVLTVSVYV